MIQHRWRLKRLSKHFCDRWRERVSNGTMPQIAAVRQIMIDSVIIQRFKQVITPSGTVFKFLTLFWHPDLKLIIRFDDSNGTAVSLLSRENMPKASAGRLRKIKSADRLDRINAVKF